MGAAHTAFCDFVQGSLDVFFLVMDFTVEGGCASLFT